MTCHRGCLVVSPPFTFPQAYCVFYFLEGGQCCWPSRHLFSQWVQRCLQAIFHPPYHQAGEPHPGGLEEKGNHIWLFVGGAGAASLDSLFRNCPVPSKDKSKIFLAHLGNPELHQSTTCHHVRRSQEVSLAAGREGSFGFVFLLSLSGIALSCCYSRNAFDVGDAHAVLTEI